MTTKEHGQEMKNKDKLIAWGWHECRHCGAHYQEYHQKCGLLAITDEK